MTKYKTPSSDHPLRVAFLGCGYATHLHSKTLKALKVPVQRFYASRTLEKADQYNRKYRGHGFFGAYESAITSPEIDVVFVATPPASHLALTRQALAAGKHVIVEKPPFFTAADFDTVRAAAETAGCQALVAENYFYKPLLRRLREVLRQNLVGDVLFIHINALKRQKTENWRDDAAVSGGGALFEGGIHWINFLNNLGLTVDSVRGFRPPPTGPLEKSMLVTFTYREGPIGTLLYSWEVPTIFQGLRISRVFGREGSITFESNGIFLFVHGRKKRLIFPGFGDIAGYGGMWQDFLKALRRGTDPQFTLDMAQNDVRLIEAAYRTAGEGKPGRQKTKDKG